MVKKSSRADDRLLCLCACALTILLTLPREADSSKQVAFMYQQTSLKTMPVEVIVRRQVDEVDSPATRHLLLDYHQVEPPTPDILPDGHEWDVEK